MRAIINIVGLLYLFILTSICYRFTFSFLLSQEAQNAKEQIIALDVADYILKPAWMHPKPEEQNHNVANMGG